MCTIRFRMLLLPLMVAIVLSEATTNPDPEQNLPAIVFRKKLGTPAKHRGTTFQRSFCAAYPVSTDGTFLTSAHCLASAPRTTTIDLVGLGTVEIERATIHPTADLAVLQLRDRNLIPSLRSVGVDSDDMGDTCSVWSLNKAFRWTVLHGANHTRCLDDTSKDKICFKLDKTPTAALDFAVVCAGGRTLHAVYHGQRGAEASFTNCRRVDCSDFVKQSATRRVKREDEAAPTADTACNAPSCNAPGSDAWMRAARDAAAPPMMTDTRNMPLIRVVRADGETGGNTAPNGEGSAASHGLAFIALVVNIVLICM